MKKQFYSILIKISLTGVLLLNGGIIYGQWQDVGNPGISDGTAIYNNLKFHNNEPYVAFKDWANNYGVTTLKFNGTNWENIGNPGFSNEVGTFLDFIFHDGEPYVAFDDNDNSRTPSIMKFNGSSWVSLPSPSSNVAYDINLASNNGTLYIAYKDFNTNFKITVKIFNGSTWETLGSQGFSAVGTFWVDLQFHNDVPYVAYKEGFDGIDGGYKATVMKYNGTSWGIVGERGFSSGQITYSDLAFYQDQPCMAYRNEAGNQTLAVMTFNGSDWVDLSSQDFTNNYASAPDLKLYNGELYVLYTTGGLGDSYARLKKYNGTNWENVSGDLVTNSVVFNTNLNFLNNEVYVAMEDYGNSRKLSVKKHTLPTLNIDNLDIYNENNIEIYPIPAHDILNIKTDEEVKVFIYDIFGKKVYSSLVNKYSDINISSLHNGIYILKLIQEDRIISKKIIKE